MPMPINYALGEERSRRAMVEIQRAGFDPTRLEGAMNHATGEQLLTTRQDMRRAHSQIIERVRAEDRELTQAEDDACGELATWIGAQTEEIAKRQQDGIPKGQARPSPGELQASAGIGAAPRASGRRDDGPLMLAPNERLEDALEERGAFASEPDFSNVPLSRIVRAYVTGDRSGVPDFATLSTGDGTLGGFLVPSRLSSRIIDLSRNQARVMQAGATTVPIMSSTSFATVESEPDPQWRAEGADVAEDDLVLGSRTFSPVTLAVMVKATIELVEDAPNVEMLIEDAIAAQLALKLDRAALFGTGVGSPLGLYHTTSGSPPSHVVQREALNGPFTSYDPLSRAVQAVAEKNAVAGDFILSARTDGEIDRLQDSDKNPLQPPRSVRERNFLTSNQVPNDLAAMAGSPPAPVNNGSAVFTGQWSDLYIAIRTPIIIEASRLSGDDFKKMMVSVRGYLRADAFAVRPNHFYIIDGAGAHVPVV